MMVECSQSKMSTFYPKIGITVVCGCPAVGKSYLCKYIQNYIQLHQKTTLCIVVHYDDEIGLISDIDNEYGLYKKFRENIFKNLECLIDKFVNLSCFTYESMKKIADIIQCKFPKSISYEFINNKTICDKIIILLDDTFHYKSMRYKINRLALKYNIGYIQIYIECDINLMMERNIKRKLTLTSHQNIHIVSNDTILQIKNIFEIPSLQNNWETNTIIINSDNLNKIDIKYLIEKLELVCQKGSILHNSFSDPSYKTTTHSSIFHEIDCILRSLVNEKIKMMNDKTQAYFINDIKNQMFSKIKSDCCMLDQLVHQRNQSVDHLRCFLALQFDLYVTEQLFKHIKL